MKNLLSVFLIVLFLQIGTFALSSDVISDELVHQQKIQNIGTKILNSNRISNKVVFLYNKESQRNAIISPSISKRQIVFYEVYYKFIENDDELAGFLSREIVLATRSYDGIFNGALRSLQIKVSPKKYELVADKQAVDYMVNAGYNPLGLITFINKSCPQKRYDRFSTKNLASKRLATIYEYIYTKYPYYLANNTYLKNEHYQNFLLTSQDNRKKLEEKINSKTKGNLKYE